MKKIILSLLFASVSLGASAQLKTAYFMDYSVPRFEMNAALTPRDGFLSVVPLTNMSFGSESNFLSLENFIFHTSDGAVTGFHPSVSASQFLSRIPSKPYTSSDFRYSLAAFGKYSRINERQVFHSGSLGLRVMEDVSIPKDLFRVMKSLGNGSYDIGDLAFGMSAYLEAAYGFAMPLEWNNLVVGGRVKVLLGAASFRGDLQDAKIDLSDDVVSIHGRGHINTSLIGKDYSRFGSGRSVSLEDLLDDVDGGGGPTAWGAAIDLGAEMTLLDDRLRVSAAVNDLGFLRWGAEHSFTGQTDDFRIEYRGYNTGEEDWDVTDPDDIELRRTSSKGYTTGLGATVNLGGEYNFLDNLLGAGLLSHTRFSGRGVQTELTVIGTVRPARWFSAAVSQTLLHNKLGALGLALNFHPRGVNIFLGADYIPLSYASFEIDKDKHHSIRVPRRTKSMNLYMGFAFTLGKSSKEF